MVNLPLLEEMRKEFESDLKEYIKEHPGELVLFEEGESGKIYKTFYKTKKELENAIEKYKGIFGATRLIEKIPIKTHRFNKNNKTLEFLSDYVGVCPNDKETKLLAESDVKITHNNEKKEYSELAYCPDCGYKVFRRPCQETIKKIESELEERFFI
jgi:DNA-directed RNA polymerase subunit RPC12/RpoP